MQHSSPPPFIYLYIYLLCRQYGLIIQIKWAQFLALIRSIVVIHTSNSCRTISA